MMSDGEFVGAGEGSRTPDLKLGKLALYRLSYARLQPGVSIAHRALPVKSRRRLPHGGPGTRLHGTPIQARRIPLAFFKKATSSCLIRPMFLR